MKRSTKIITGVVLSLGIAGGVAAYSTHGGWHRGEHFIGHVKDELDLTPEQTAALEAVRDQMLEIRDAMHAERQERGRELLSVIDGTVLDQTRALQLVTEKTTLVNQHAPAVIAALAGFYDSLDPGQQAALRAHVGQRMQRHRH